MVAGVDGLPGISVVRHVMVEFRIELEHVMPLNQSMEDFTAMEQ